MKLIALITTAAVAQDTIYTKPGEECNDIWRMESNIMNPWPERCQVYKTSNECNRYEMSEDGQTILSCDEPEACGTVSTPPKCFQYYKDSAVALGAGLGLGLALLVSSPL